MFLCGDSEWLKHRKSYLFAFSLLELMLFWWNKQVVWKFSTSVRLIWCRWFSPGISNRERNGMVKKMQTVNLKYLIFCLNDFISFVYVFPFLHFRFFFHKYISYFSHWGCSDIEGIQLLGVFRPILQTWNNSPCSIQNNWEGTYETACSHRCVGHVAHMV